MDDTVQEHMKLVKKVGQTIFNNGADRDSRSRALLHPNLFTDSDPASFAKIIQYFVVLLNKFRAQLVTHYKNYKPKDPRDRSFFTPDVHGNCHVLLQKLMESLRNDKTELWPWDHIEDRIAYLSKKKGQWDGASHK